MKNNVKIPKEFYVGYKGKTWKILSTPTRIQRSLYSYSDWKRCYSQSDAARYLHWQKRSPGWKDRYISPSWTCLSQASRGLLSITPPHVNHSRMSALNLSCPTGCMQDTKPLTALGTEGYVKCHWGGERLLPPLLSGTNKAFIVWTRSFKLMVWKPNLAIYCLWSIDNCELVTNIKRWEKSSTKKRRYMAPLKTGSLAPLCPFPSMTVSRATSRPFPAPPSTPRAVLVSPPALLVALKIPTWMGTLCQSSQHFRIQTPSLTRILIPQQQKKFFVKLCFLIHSLENTVTVIIT